MPYNERAISLHQVQSVLNLELGGDILRAALGTMVGFIFLSFVVSPMIFEYFFGLEAVDWSPIYSGMILLSGIIVLCTKTLIEEINELKEKEDGKISKN